MSVAYRGVFSESDLSLEDAVREVSSIFREVGLSFSGNVSRLGAGFSFDLSFYGEEGHDLETGLQLDRIDQVFPMLSKWQGISILYHWNDLVEATGDSILSEIDFYLSRLDKGCEIAFEEDRTANTCRREDQTLVQSFYRAILGICERIGILYCVYGDASSLEDLKPNKEIVKEILKTGMLPAGGVAACVVFPARSFVWEDIQKQTLSYGRELMLSSSGYGILKLEPPEE